MRAARLLLAFPDGAPGKTLILGAEGGEDLSSFPMADTLIVESMAQHHAALHTRGFSVATKAEGTFDTVLITLPRARNAARARLSEAAAHLAAGGQVWIDGQKTDGIEAFLKELKSLCGVAKVHSKAHGKIAKLEAPEKVPPGWAAQDMTPAPGFTTRPGVFSADAVDAGSAALAAALPDKLPTRIVDLGAGWGWLSAQILSHPGVEILHLVEADHTAISCAKANITDPRARFHWTDARIFKLPEPVNGVIMNPPFHEGRRADPALGTAFIRAAASVLTGAGRLWLVANRHLPYESELSQHFAEIRELSGDSRFKILTASGADARHRRHR